MINLTISSVTGYVGSPIVNYTSSFYLEFMQFVSKSLSSAETGSLTVHSGNYDFNAVRQHRLRT